MPVRVLVWRVEDWFFEEVVIHDSRLLIGARKRGIRQSRTSHSYTCVVDQSGYCFHHRRNFEDIDRIEGE